MRLPPAKVWLPVLLMVGYPLLSHAAALLHLPELQWLALLAVTATPMSGALLRGRLGFWLLLALLAAALWWLVNAGGGQYALYLPPLVLPLALSAGFALTLRPGHTALITTIADAAHGPLADEMWRYTRRLTAFWALLAAGMASITLWLTLYGPLWAWSLFTNFISYGVIGSVFVVEFLLRRRWFPAHPHGSFAHYLGIVLRSRRR